MWNTDDGQARPTSWDVMLDPRRRRSTRARSASTTTRSTSPTPRVYLKAHQPDLGIDNPYELNEEQFNAAVDLLKQQQPNVGEYWSTR
jgi:putative spermidine/putrescine transport system substrate-binding protein